MPWGSQRWTYQSTPLSMKPHGRSDRKVYKSAAERQRAYRARERIKNARAGLKSLKRRPMPAWQRMRKMRGDRVARPYQIHMSARQLAQWMRENIF